MSHFSAFVLIPESEVVNAEEYIGELIEEYDEGKEVPEYMRECYCVGRKQQKEIRELTEEYITQVNILNKQKDVERDVFKIRNILLSMQLRLCADKDCPECKGTGEVTSTYNPQSEYDYFLIGGRWNNVLPNNSNFIKVKEFLLLKDTDFEKKLPFALIESNGDWNKSVDIGWFGVSSNDKEQNQWSQEVRRILENNKEYMIAVIDCHI